MVTLPFGETPTEGRELAKRAVTDAMLMYLRDNPGAALEFCIPGARQWTDLSHRFRERLPTIEKNTMGNFLLEAIANGIHALHGTADVRKAEHQLEAEALN